VERVLWLQPVADGAGDDGAGDDGARIRQHGTNALRHDVGGSGTLQFDDQPAPEGFFRYSRDGRFVVLGENRRFVLVMAAGSIVGTFVGGRLLGFVPNAVLLPLLAIILVLSAVKVWRHK
jgi:hypothetical protein